MQGRLAPMPAAGSSAASAAARPLLLPLVPEPLSERLRVTIERHDASGLERILQRPSSPPDGQRAAATLALRLSCWQPSAAGAEMSLRYGADPAGRGEHSALSRGEPAGPTALHLLCVPDRDRGSPRMGAERGQIASLLLARGAEPWATARPDGLLEWTWASDKPITLQPVTAALLAALQQDLSLARQLQGAAMAWRSDPSSQSAYATRISSLWATVASLRARSQAWANMSADHTQRELREAAQSRFDPGRSSSAPLLLAWSQQVASLVTDAQHLQLEWGFGQHHHFEQCASLIMAQLADAHDQLVRWGRRRLDDARPAAGVVVDDKVVWSIFFLLHRCLWLIDRLHNTLCWQVDPTHRAARPLGPLPACLEAGALHASALVERRRAGLLNALPLLASLGQRDWWRVLQSSGLQHGQLLTDVPAALGLSLLEGEATEFRALSPTGFQRQLIASTDRVEQIIGCFAVALQHHRPDLVAGLGDQYARCLASQAGSEALMQSANSLVRLALNGPILGLTHLLQTIDQIYSQRPFWPLQASERSALFEAARLSGTHLQLFIDRLPRKDWTSWRHYGWAARLLPTALQAGNVRAAEALWSWRPQCMAPIAPTYALLASVSRYLVDPPLAASQFVAGPEFRAHVLPAVLSAAARYVDRPLLCTLMANWPNAWTEMYAGGQNILHLLARADAHDLLADAPKHLERALLQKYVAQLDDCERQPVDLTTLQDTCELLQSFAPPTQSVRANLLARVRRPSRGKALAETGQPAQARGGHSPSSAPDSPPPLARPTLAAQVWAQVRADVVVCLAAVYSGQQELQAPLEALATQFDRQWARASNAPTFVAERRAVMQAIEEASWEVLDRLVLTPLAGRAAPIAPSSPTAREQPAASARFASTDARPLLTACIEALRDTKQIRKDDYGLYACIGMQKDLRCEVLPVRAERAQPQARRMAKTTDIYVEIRRDYARGGRLSFVTLRPVPMERRAPWHYWKWLPALPDAAAYA